jgi:hypothetical protein
MESAFLELVHFLLHSSFTLSDWHVRSPKSKTPDLLGGGRRHQRGREEVGPRLAPNRAIEQRADYLPDVNQLKTLLIFSIVVSLATTIPTTNAAANAKTISMVTPSLKM